MLRALAALIVLITHFSDVTGWLDTSLGGRAEQYGVMLFFMLSGFLMAYLYFDKPFAKDNIKHYLLARAGRVLPLYFIVVLLSFCLPLLGFQGLYDISQVNYLVSHLLFVKGESVLWTIAPEIQFYLLFLGFWFLAAWRPGYIYVVVVVTLLLLFFTNFPRPHGSVGGVPYDLHLFRSLPCFLIGMVLGANYKSIKVPAYLRKNIFLLALLLIPMLYPDFSPVRSDAKMRMWLSYEVLLVMSAVFFCVVFMVPDNNPLLANRVGDFLGKISYSLYLLHMPILVQLNKLSLPDEWALVIFLVSSILVAYLCYQYVERPFAKWIRAKKLHQPTNSKLQQAL